MINKKIIAGIGCKNEEFIIHKTLTALSTFCYKIIIVDDNSTDKTEEICKSFEKVEFHKRPVKKDWRLREDGKQRQEIINFIKPYNPDYCLFLDADEIPSPDIINFINNIDTKINLWKLPWVHLWKDENHYRVDSYKIGGSNIIWDPYNGGQRKGFLMKFNKNILYQYDINKHLSVPMEPMNVPKPYSTTEKTRIIHWGKISEYFKTGKKDEDYAKMKSFTDKNVNFQQRNNHHKACRSEQTLKLQKVKKEWKWEIN